jgi:hypothetical protein
MQRSRCLGTPGLSNINDDHQFPMLGYNCMIHSEYIATSNQLQEFCRNGNKEMKWQQKGAEIVVLPFFLATSNPLVMTSDGFCYFVAIFELCLIYSHHAVDALSATGSS